MKLKIKNKKIDVEVADKIWKHTKGLSFSKKKRNMLFIMPFESRWSFWMFGMRYPIYITFLNDKKKPMKTVYAKPMTLNPRTWKIHKPRRKCKYILETYKKL